MRNRVRRGLAAALIGAAAVGATVASTTAASAAAWTQTTLIFNDKGACVWAGQQDVADGVALNYYCNYEYMGTNFNGPSWVWHLYEFVD